MTPGPETPVQDEPEVQHRSTAGRSAEPAARAALIDGRVVTIRPLVSGDAPAVRELHENLPDHDRYLRFFTLGTARLPEFVARLTTTDDTHRGALGAFLGDELIGVAHYEVLADPGEGEVALAVSHAVQSRGVGMLLLEHLVSLARRRGVRRFVAEVLAGNGRMLGVFSECGLPVVMHGDGGVLRVVMTLDGDEHYRSAVTEREARAGNSSLRSVLCPRSITVIGAGRHSGSIGNAVLRSIRDGGYTGTLTAVNPRATRIAGLPCYPSVAALPKTPDLAVVCVPAEAVAEVAGDCGRRGVRALLVITSGLTGHAEQAQLLDAVRRYGMRLVGPNCLGLVNADPKVRLDATFAGLAAPRGHIGVATQSGGAGVALLSQFGPLGLGVSTLVSTGDKYDVSGNDLLRWWCDDEHTHVAVLYLESFGNPTKFSRLARRLGRRIPVIALRTGSTEPAQRAAASHTAAAATPAVTRDALYRQAGVIAVDTLTELLATTALLSWQPVPAGGNVLVIGNAGGFGVLAADACARLGLVLPELSAHTRAALAELLPSHASLHNPVDTTAGVGATTFESCLDAVLADEQVHAVIVSAAPTALGDPGAAIGRALARARRHGTGTPVLAVAAGQPEMVAPHRVGKAGIVPSYADPALAAQALAHAVDYGRWRARPAGVLPELPGLDAAPAQDLVAGFLAEHPNGGWLDPGAVQTLLSCFGVPVLSGTVAATDREALAALRAAGGPVALKAVAPGVLHKSRSHGVVLGVADEQRLTTELAGLRERFGERLTGVFVQPMAAAGRELLIGVHSDGTFGPLVVFGLGGVDADLITDRAARLVPLTDVDADDLMASLRSSPTLFTPSSAELDPAAVRDVLLRTGRLAELLPQIAELDLNPVIATPDGATVIDARIRLRPAAHTDPTLRALRA